MKKVVQTPQVQLYSGMSGTDVTCRISPYPKDLDGVKLTYSDFGDNPTFTADPKIKNYEEINSFTGIVDNGDDTGTLTGLVRDLSAKFPYTASGSGKMHGPNSVIVFGNNPQQAARAAFKENDETITGNWMFPAPTNPSSPVRLQDLQSAVFTGGVPASSTAMGVTRLSTNPNTNLGTPTISIANPAVITLTAHGLTVNDLVQFTTSGTLPLNITAGATYFVLAAGLTANTFEISSSSGGTPISTLGGTQSGTHTLTKVTPVALSPDDTRLPTQNQKNAMIGYSGSLPNTQNPFLDKASLSNGNSLDQSQTIQNSSVNFAEADATTKHLLIAQSFISGASPIKSVNLFKTADVGTFTGDVTISLQADVAGAPSGTALATVTILNAAWAALPAADFLATFGAEYISTLGTTYWIVASATTADNANHPTLGASSAGGYGSGSVKFKNTTDGWTAIATIDLYFKVNIDTANKIATLDTNGQIPTSSLSALINSYPAYEAQTAGQPLKFVQDGGIKKFSTIKGMQQFVSTLTVSGNPVVIDTCRLNATQAVVIINGITSSGLVDTFYAVIATINGNNITWGTPVTIDSINRSSSPRNDWGYSQSGSVNADAMNMRIYRVSDTAFMVGGLRILSGVSGYLGCGLFVGTVAGSTITLGSYNDGGNTATSGFDRSFYGLAEVDTDYFCVVANAQGNTTLKLYHVTEAGQSFSTIASYTLGWGGQTRIAKLSTNRVVAWQVGSPGNYAVLTTSPSAINLVATSTGVPASTGPFSQMLSINQNNEGIFVYMGTSTINVVNFSESAGVLSFAGGYTKNAVTNVYQGNGRVVGYDPEQNEYLVGYQGPSGNTFFSKAKDLGSTIGAAEMINIDYQTSQGLNGGNTAFASPGKQRSVFLQVVSTNTLGGVVSFDYDQFVGFAQNTVAAGATQSLNNIGRVDTHQTGLVSNALQYLHADATLGPIDGVQINSFTYATGVKVGRSISTTEIYVTSA
jgi:hypothetical protein